MNEQNNVPETTNAHEAIAPILPYIQDACDIAAGREAPDNDAEAIRIRGAKKDLNCKGRGEQWFRMVYRDGSWTYVSEERLPSGSFRAAERRATVYGDVFPGEIIVSHDRGAPVDLAYIAVESDDQTISSTILEIPFSKRRDGNLKFTLPDGTEIVLPNPRKVR